MRILPGTGTWHYRCQKSERQNDFTLIRTVPTLKYRHLWVFLRISQDLHYMKCLTPLTVSRPIFNTLKGQFHKIFWHFFNFMNQSHLGP